MIDLSRHRALSLRKLAAAAAIATTLFTPLTGSPAVAGAPDDLWNAVNAAHVAAGCPAYTRNNVLNGLALDYAKSMAFYGGRTQTTAFHVGTDELLTTRGYSPKSWGEMDYYNPKGKGSVDRAIAFWKKNLAQVISNCGHAQLGIGIWSVDNSYGASAILGTKN